MPSDDEVMRRLQNLADNERPMTVDFGDGPGPFALPKCGPQISAQLLEGGQSFVLELETEKHQQRVQVEIDGRGLAALEITIRAMRKHYGVGETKN